MRTYDELMSIEGYLERFEYLKIGGTVGHETFGSRRLLNQILYRLPEWRYDVRPKAIARDLGFDMGHKLFPIKGIVVVHHMNPITVEDIINRDPKVFNLDYLISVADQTHKAIHYSDSTLLETRVYIERSPNDTCPWKGNSPCQDKY